jgi:hypothetical protein
VHKVSAQNDLEIRKAFEQYGNKKGVVMVELSNELLEGYDFVLFKSLTIKNDPSAADYIRKCLAQDEKGAKKVKQIVNNGKPTSIYLQLPVKSNKYRLILFNEMLQSEKDITLIYIESKTDSEEILKLITKKK